MMRKPQAMNKQTVIIGVKKMCILCIGILLMAFGGIFCVKGSIGLAPKTSLPYALSIILDCSLGFCSAAVNVALIFLQILLLRKHFKLYQILQFLVAVFMGVTIDFAQFCLTGLNVSGIVTRWFCCAVGAALIALGIVFEISSDSVSMPGDATVNAICWVSGMKFGTAKVWFDVGTVVLTAILSYCFLGKIVGVREGTIFLALVTGSLVRFFHTRLGFLTRFLEKTWRL